MAVENELGHAPPSWFVPFGEHDFFAWLALALVALAIYGIFYLYGKFDHWAEHRAKGTPLAKTIPTLLAIGLLYEIFPLGHFSVLLPITAILIALMADWTHFRFGQTVEAIVDPVPVPVLVPGTAPKKQKSVAPEEDVPEKPIGEAEEIQIAQADKPESEEPKHA